MIEVVSADHTFTGADGKSLHYYLELYGETQPQIDETYAQVLSVSPDTTTEDTYNSSGPIYEYWWTLGHSIDQQSEEHPILDRVLSRPEEFWHNLRELHGAVARVYLYFPVSHNWRIKELTATLKYLSPVPQQKKWTDAIASQWKGVSTLMADTSTVAGAVPLPAFAGASKLLGALAKVQVNSVPPNEDITWSVEKVTYGKPPNGVMQGILWNLPLSAFELLGSRITGSVALSFIPAHAQEAETVLTSAVPPEQGSIQAHAVVYGPQHEEWAPGPDGRNFMKLAIAPVAPGAQVSKT